MKRFKDERLSAEMDAMQAKLFRYMIICFMVVYVIKLVVLKDYSEVENTMDNFILLSTVIYAAFLQFRSKTDFYQPRSIYKIVFGAAFLGFVSIALLLVENDFSLQNIELTIFVLAFLKGVWFYLIICIIVETVRKYRHRLFEKNLENEDDI